MAALASCAVRAALLAGRTGSAAPLPTRSGQQPPPDPGTISLTVPEVRRLVATAAQSPPGHAAHWSSWTRRHQARARWFHHRTRLERLPADGAEHAAAITVITDTPLDCTGTWLPSLADRQRRNCQLRSGWNGSTLTASEAVSDDSGGRWSKAAGRAVTWADVVGCGYSGPAFRAGSGSCWPGHCRADQRSASSAAQSWK
jgi:hypothetical protein